LEVDADGYEPFQRSIILPGGDMLHVDVQLVSKVTAGMLVVTSEPAGGVVFVDDRELGNAPVEASVRAGSHSVVVHLSGFVDRSTSVVVGAGERRVVTLALGRSTPVTKKWWFWTGLGAVVATGVIVTYAALKERAPGTGTIPPGETTAP
ncbi:MAG: PEGA domain-containing protein, partial [Polyangiaceae bacterium]